MADRCRILLVDDEVAVLELLRRLLTDAGHQVTAFSNAEDALAFLESAQGQDLVVADALVPTWAVVTDVRLPRMNGCAMGREIIRRWPGTRLLFISGYVAEELKRRGICPGTLPLVPKPFSFEAFLAAVDDTLCRPPWRPREDEWTFAEGGA